MDLPRYLDLERLAVVAPALALLARHVDVRQEVHLDRDDAVALAGFASAALDVEREAAGLVAARPRFGQHREQLADEREQPGVGRGIRPRRAADRRLIDLDDLVDQIRSPRSPRARRARPSRDRACVASDAVQDFVDERRLARSADAGHGDERAQRERDVDVLEVVRAGAAHDELAAFGLAPSTRDLDPLLAGEVLPGQRLAGDAISCCGRPWNITWPPCSPAPGPRSTR